MFSINSDISKNNNLLIIIVILIILHFFFNNSSQSIKYAKSDKSTKHSKPTKSAKSTKPTKSAKSTKPTKYAKPTESVDYARSQSNVIDKNYIKKAIEKQEHMLKELQSKIEKKLMNIDLNAKIDSIETMDDTVKQIKIKPSGKTPRSIKEESNIISNPDETIISSYPQHPANPNFNPYPHPPMNYIRHGRSEPSVDPMYIRDNQVLNDRLYPPHGRTERPTADLLLNFINNRQDLFNMHTRGPPDTFRPIGYLTKKDSAGQDMDSTLILFGRAKYPNSDLGEFYVTSSNKLSDVKIPLLPTNSNVRKITDVPNDVQITGPILPGTYSYFELPRPDFTVPYM
jgi:hypothetical protein